MTQVREGAQPLAPAGASYLAAATAIILIVLGGVGVREALVAAGWISGASWIADTVSAADGAAPMSWTPFAGIAAGILGIILVGVALKPRRRRAVRARAQSAVFVDVTDIARIASASAQAVPGVVSARSTASRRTLTVRCEVSGTPEADLNNAVNRAVTTELAALEHAPRIRVRMAGRTSR
ncbi:DUF6286 domain-containing protein [Mycolicibacterium sp. BiH015]|uniref:DUF6286 domain-containing protein n=1 Tax=Mycolicibacterium sp. BiH015 TaxID=3018808 RepID=UPI0022DFA947|nr:DUF6286 domain-containing protein [Mycolicibacterium sp. BiH015]MDA2892533.1 DUF6286 domain-containing protein [Mycolicibacterium sp. BiH015]